MLILLLAVALPACDSNGGDDDDDQQFGTFSLEISGDAELSMEGFAFFGEAEDPDTDEQVFVIYFSETADVSATDATWALLARTSGRPGTGSYTIVDLNQGEDDIPDEEFMMMATVGATQATSVTYIADGGTLNISQSNSNRVQGSFTTTASGFNLGTGEEINVTIEGSFDAFGSDDVFVPFAP